MANPASTLLDTTHQSGQQPLKWLIWSVAMREHNKHCTYCVSSTLTQMPTHKRTNTCSEGERKTKREKERKSRHCMEPWGITLAHTGLHFISCGLCQCCLFTSWESAETGGNVCDVLDLETPQDSDLLFVKNGVSGREKKCFICSNGIKKNISFPQNVAVNYMRDETCFFSQMHLK